MLDRVRAEGRRVSVRRWVCAAGDAALLLGAVALLLVALAMGVR